VSKSALRRQLERLIARWQAEILAEEGYSGGLVCVPAADLESDLPKQPGLIALLNDHGAVLCVEALEDLSNLPPNVRTAMRHARRACVLTASDQQEAQMLRDDVARRLAQMD
jgi:hypothetical protein